MTRTTSPPDQMPEEIDFVLDFSLNILRAFGFNGIHTFAGTKPEKSVGDPAQWKDAENALEASLKRLRACPTGG